MTRTELDQKLSKGIYTITFTKINGDKRTMRCTRDILHIPKNKRPTNSGYDRDDVLAVYDLDNNDWRSFRVDSLISITS